MQPITMCFKYRFHVAFGGAPTKCLFPLFKHDWCRTEITKHQRHQQRRHAKMGIVTMTTVPILNNDSEKSYRGTEKTLQESFHLFFVAAIAYIYKLQYW